MKRYSTYFILLTFFIIACKNQQTAASNKNKAPESRLSEADKSAFESAFYEGNKQMILGNHANAITQFKKCVLLDPKSDAALYLLAKEYNITRQFSVSLVYSQSAAKLDPKNIWYQLLVADNLKHTDNNLEAAQALENIADKFKSYESYYFDASESYIVSKKYKEAIRCLDKLEKISGVNEEISFKKEDLFLKLNKKDLAIAELKKLIAAFPKRTRYQIALAEVYYGFKEEAEANAIIQKVLATQPDMPEAHLLLANIYRSKGEYEKSFQELRIVFANPEADVKQKLEIISSYLPVMEQNNTLRSQTLELGSLLVKAHPIDESCALAYADILFTAEKYQEAKTYYLKVIEKSKSNFSLWQNLILCEENLKEYEACRKHSDEALEAFPGQAIFHFYKAHFAFQMKDYTTAAIAAKNGYDIGSDRIQLVIQLLSVLGDANNALSKFSESDDAFDKILVIDPNNLQTLNNYSYYLSLRKEHLDRAAEMSKKTLSIDPNNASYLDTYGWILYQQKKFTEAKTYIEKALQIQPDNAALNEHIGDVYFQLNDHEMAIKYWKKSKDAGNNSNLLIQKINSGKLID